MKQQVKCDVYSRVSGYFQRVANFNRGKKEEFRQRKTLKFSLAEQKEPIQAASHNS